MLGRFFSYGDAAGATVVAPTIDDTTREQVIGLYTTGHKTADITEQTGVGRSSIYFILRSAGIKPDRLKRKGTTMGVEPRTSPARPPSDDPSSLLNWALDRVADLEHDLTEVRAENARVEERLRLARLALTQ